MLVDSGTSGNYFDDLYLPEVKRRLLSRTDLTVPRKILSDTTEPLSQCFVIDEHGNPYLSQIDFSIVLEQVVSSTLSNT